MAQTAPPVASTKRTRVSDHAVRLIRQVCRLSSFTNLIADARAWLRAAGVAAARPGKSAIDAVRQARQRCWRYDWVLDLDVKAYFDSIDWELMLRAVRRHTNQPWVLLYIERWLKAPVQLEDGSAFCSAN